MTHHADPQGTAVIYGAINKAVCQVRACRAMDDNWKKSIDRDFQSRN